MADHSKVQAALDTAVALAIAKMKESEHVSVLKKIESHVHGLLKDMDDDDKILLTTYHEELCENVSVSTRCSKSRSCSA